MAEEVRKNVETLRATFEREKPYKEGSTESPAGTSC